MCEFCLQHGEGQKWYLQAKNYSEDLLSDARRRKFIAEFFSRSAEERGQSVRGMDASLDRLNRAPGFVRSMISGRIGSQAKKEHHGQVLPIEDVEQILGFVNSVARVACVCRMGIYGPEPRFCYGMSMAPPEVGPFAFLHDDPSYRGGPVLDNMETLTKEEALAAFRHHEQEGLCHTVWTFVTPFIGGVCNCDRQECQAMRATLVHRLPHLHARLPVRRHQLQPVAGQGGHRAAAVLRVRHLPRPLCARRDLAERPAGRSGGGQLVVGVAYRLGHKPARCPRR